MPWLPDERCPCGSGRTFQSCCADVCAKELVAFDHAQDIERRLTHAILTYAIEEWGWGLIDASEVIFGLREASAMSLAVAPVFDRWLAFSHVPRLHDPEDSAPASWPDVPLAVAWLASGRGGCPVESAFILQAAESPFSALKIESLRRGWDLTVRDLMTGGRFRVVDPEVASRARVNDTLFSAVLALDGVSTLLGAAPFTMPPDVVGSLREIREFYGGGWMTRRDLVETEIAGEICHEYLAACSNGPMPLLRWADGPPEEAVHLRWRVSLLFEQAFERLRPMTLTDEDEDDIELDTGPDGDPHAVFTCYRRAPSGDPGDWVPAAFLYLDEGALAADAPNRLTADSLLREIATRLGTDATFETQHSAGQVRAHTRGCWLPVRTV
jgi:hypothetical protein